VKKHELDGFLIGDSEGRLWRVYEPRWWQVGRWWRWLRVLLRKRVAVGKIDFSQSHWDQEHQRYRHDRMKLRCLSVHDAPRNFLDTREIN
jgi:hypothetical protein